MRRPTCRINSGRGHSYRLDGQNAMSVTDVISKAISKPGLPGWAARETAGYAADNLARLDGMKRDEIVDLLKGAPWRERDRAANRGTEVHSLAQRLAAGEEIEVPDELVGHVDAYLQWRELWEPDQELVERSVFSRTWKYAGTFDLLCRLRELGQTLVDIKTNRSGPFGETALQLAGYANADFYLDDAGYEHEMPEIESFAVLWLRADGYDLIPYEVTDREWRAFLYARHVASWVDNRMPVVRQPALIEPQEASA